MVPCLRMLIIHDAYDLSDPPRPLRNIRQVIAYTFQVCHKVQKDDAALHLALAGLEPLHVRIRGVLDECVDAGSFSSALSGHGH